MDQWRVARHTAVAGGPKRGRCCTAAILRVGTARRKGAAGRHGRQRRLGARNFGQAGARRQCLDGQRGQQSRRVGVCGVGQQRVDRTLFDDPAGVHDRRAVCRLGDHAQVVGDGVIVPFVQKVAVISRRAACSMALLPAAFRTTSDIATP